MNRIILIGNGFDLAHGLPTGYSDFIKDYWNKLAHRLFFYRIGGEEDDNLMHIRHNLDPNNLGKEWRLETWNEMQVILKNDENSKFECKCPLFERINKSIETFGWVDVENVYYTLLKKIIQPGIISNPPYKNPQKLNDDLNLIKDKLASYLSRIQEEKISPELINDGIRSKIYEPFNIDDIALGSKPEFDKSLLKRLDDYWNQSEGITADFLSMFGISYLGYRSNFDLYIPSIVVPPKPNDSTDKHPKYDAEKHLNNIHKKDPLIPNFFLLPDQLLFLNFNYTKTAKLYISNSSNFKLNHIHGELGNENNPVIFGYGDELDEDYKAISNLNDNDYLKNIKSIRYLETDNYRQLLRFIDSAPYQIYIMGHSCGNSDRTLLNTLFEHQNCVSIKPFYHQRADGSDNYIEIIQNISRNFNNKQMMRDRVVNKTYCRPLVNPA